MQQDHQANNIDPPYPKEVFKLVVDYQIDEDNLVVNIPVKEIDYPRHFINEMGDAIPLPVYSVEVLKYFGAANNQTRGYMLVPDGSGALINLNNEKINIPQYIGYIYGVDNAVMPKEERVVKENKIRIPVYGMKKGNKAFFAIIEDGEALGRIKAEVAGHTNSFNSIFSEFVVIEKGTIQLSGENIVADNPYSILTTYQSRIYQGDIKIRYSFLNGKKANYVGMSEEYREYLQKKYGMCRLRSEDNIPFFLELIGGIDRKTFVFGAPRESVSPLTSYKQALDILKEIKERGLHNIYLKYTGWSRGGIKHFYPDKVPLEKNLGDKKDFNKLLSFIKKNKIKYFPDISFLNIYRNELFDGFKPSRDGARFLNRKNANAYDYNPASFQKIDGSGLYLLSPGSLKELLDEFLRDYNAYGISGLSLRYMGEQLNGDYRDDEDKMIDRQQARKIIVEGLKKLESNNLDLLINGGNAMVLPYTDKILHIPLTDSGADILDVSIPFYQLVLHGMVNYAGRPYNQTSDYKYKLLKTLETGALPYYRWTYKDSSAFKNTDYEYLISTGYKDWIEEAAYLYKKLNPILGELQNKYIVNHRQIAENVYETTYENGIKIIVNYNHYPVNYKNREINGKDYLLLKGGE